MHNVRQRDAGAMCSKCCSASFLLDAGSSMNGELWGALL